MTPQQIVGLGIRLAALLLAFKSLSYLLFTPLPLLESDVSYHKWMAYLVGFIHLALAIVLWLFPMWIAHKLLPRTQFENRLEIRSLEAARVGCGLIGLFLFCKTLPNLIWYFFSAFLVVGNYSFFSSLNAEAKLDLATSIAQTVFSFFLIARSDVFARLLIRERHSVKQENTDNGLQKFY